MKTYAVSVTVRNEILYYVNSSRDLTDEEIEDLFYENVLQHYDEHKDYEENDYAISLIASVPEDDAWYGKGYDLEHNPEP